jgi:hypothetical protein
MNIALWVAQNYSHESRIAGALCICGHWALATFLIKNLKHKE